MKRLLALLLALMMVFALVACDEGGNTDDPKDENASTVPNIDIGSIMNGNGTTDTVWGKQDEATKQQIIAEGKKDGVDISFGADGSMTVVDPESGDTVIQNPDGTWTIKNDDGTIGQYGGEWPENEFTKLLPKPDFSLVGASSNDDEFAVLFQNVTVEQIRDYAEKVKAKGFTAEAELTDQEAMGMVIYSYQAKNADGYSVSVTFTGGAGGLVVQKP